MDTEEKVRDHLLSLYILAAIAAHGARYPAPYVHRWLGVLASYLNANTANPTGTPRVIAGRPLSGTDLVLHEMWPLAGFRLPRIGTVSVTATVCLSIGAVEVIDSALAGLGPRQIAYYALDALFVAAGIGYSWTAWPPPSLLDFRQSIEQIKTNLRQRRFPSNLLFGLLGALVIGLIGRFWVGLPFVGALIAGLIIAPVIAS